MLIHRRCRVALRLVLVAGLMAGAAVAAGSDALAQSGNPSGAQGPTISSPMTPADLNDAGVVVAGFPQPASTADDSEEAAAASAEASPLPDGPAQPSGVIGAAAPAATPTAVDLAAAGVR